MTPDVEELLKAQLEAFRKKFGRDPGPGDPVFFDLEEDEPSPADFEAEILRVMNSANLPPEFAYAFRKTGLLGLGADKSQWPPENVKEWNDAVDEYRAIQAAENRPGRPDPRQWSTQIPELLMSPFNQEDLDQVRECLGVIAPIEARGLKVATRIELAAALLASACEHAYRAGVESGEPGGGADLFARTEEIVLRRAREIYAQDHA